MSVALELLIATYIIVRLTTTTNRYETKPAIRLVTTLYYVCVVCWLVVVVQAIRALIH